MIMEQELSDLVNFHEMYKKKITELRVELVNLERKLSEVNEKIAERLDLNISAKIQTMKAQSTPKSHLNPGGRRLEVVEYLKTHPSASCVDMSKDLGITVNNARSVVQALVRKHLVNRNEAWGANDYVTYSLAVHPDNNPVEVNK